MHEVISIRCDGCRSLHDSTLSIRKCGYCEQEGCIDCVKHYSLLKGLINTWIHIKNTSNYGRSCLEDFHIQCKDREIDPDL